MRLESGPAWNDRIRYLFIVGLFVGWGLWAFYDWQVGYANKNYKVARQELAKIAEGAAPKPQDLPERPQEPDFEQLRAADLLTPQKVRDALGEPFAVKGEGTAQKVEYYASRYGLAVVPIVGGRVSAEQMTWTKWSKSRDEIEQQFWWGSAAVAIGLWFAVGLFRAWTLRVTIDDRGMTYAGRLIPFDTIRRLANYSAKGWVDVFYELGGQERKLRLDSYKVEKFHEIIEAICHATDFQDPRVSPEVEAEAQAEADRRTPDDASTPPELRGD
jgi:hypothetical protein